MCTLRSNIRLVFASRMEWELLKIWFVSQNIPNYQQIKWTLVVRTMTVGALKIDLESLKM
jgi:hypothetical protein